jgi:hypothetical protein
MSLWLVSIVIRLLPNLTFRFRDKELLLEEEYVDFVHSTKNYLQFTVNYTSSIFILRLS